jgi:hypothetical protein
MVEDEVDHDEVELPPWGYEASCRLVRRGAGQRLSEGQGGVRGEGVQGVRDVRASVGR